MGLLDFFKKKPPGQCSSCQKNVADFRCPSCGAEHCAGCVKAWAEKWTQNAKTAGPAPKISITSSGVVNTAASSAITDRVNQRMNAIREMAAKGRGICLVCTVQKEKTVALKPI